MRYRIKKVTVEEFEIEEVTIVQERKHPVLKRVAVVTVWLLSVGVVGVLWYGWATQDIERALSAVGVIGVPLAVAARYLFRK